VTKQVKAERGLSMPEIMAWIFKIYRGGPKPFTPEVKMLFGNLLTLG